MGAEKLLFEKSAFVLLSVTIAAGCGAANGGTEPGSALPGEADPAAQRPEAMAADRRLEAGGRLERQALVQAVVERNPSVEAARQAFRAARAREPQAESLPDPMLMYEFAPFSIGSSRVKYGQTVRVSQTFPWPGKVLGKRRSARAMADAMREEIEVVRLELALEASELFDEYWLTERKLAVNTTHQKLLGELGQTARVQYEVGRGSLQDPLQAEVELTMLERMTLMLEAERSMIRAQLNALLHRRPEAPLPPPPDSLEVSEAPPPPSSALQRQALANRGELRALGARVRAAQAMGQAASREYYPDVTVSGSYSSMWEMWEHQWMVGIEVPIPLNRGSRAGMVEEASAEAASNRSQVAREADTILREVEMNRLRVIESIGVVDLYRRRLLPVARDQLKAARAGYGTSANDFFAVIGAQKNLLDVEIAFEEARAELSKRRARLARSIGEMPGGER
jgi:outer membrane protein, heavy metal efflux system